MAPLSAVSASVGISILRSTPSLFQNLLANTTAARAILEKADGITIPSHPASPIILLYIDIPGSQFESAPAHHKHKSNMLTHECANPEVFDRAVEEAVLMEIEGEALAGGVMVARARRPGMPDARPGLRLVMTSALSKKDTEKAATTLKAAITKVLARRR